ncbi:DMT family transporter [Ureibacillus aquaedulcis]|uniref:DMT family transporter n=1 Tax=Ureibacillus aquaedulcis TaxID=3058421 RepID=A0ABT8GNH4_9BACL|nr:DMT family transporter [Ureibacillus sp. BA0131]MDN4492841.1 DMT family transporter [Ureibacillus sp. BA0131]
MILGISLAIVAGAFIGLQNIFNRHLNEQVSSWFATAFVLLTGSMASLLIGFLFQGSDIFDISGMKRSYWFFGLVGVGVIYSMIQAMHRLGPTKTVLISIIAQLTFSLIFDVTGFLSLPKVELKWEDIVGVVSIIVGVIIFNARKKGQVEQAK